MTKKELFLSKLSHIKDIINEIVNKGGKPYLVGGSVRDFILEKDIKDLDIEVHEVSLELLQDILSNFGKVSLVGKKFGVLRLNDFDIDWSLPRSDSKGRRPDVIVDPYLGIEKSCRRRDLTINSLAIDLSVNFEDIDSINNIKILDFYGGVKDIKNKALRAVDNKLFIQDPLRFYRVMQFIGELARERVYEEIKKLLLKSRRPSLGFRWINKIGRLKELFCELGDLVGIKQREDFHPEIDAFEHTMQSIDAATLINEKNISNKFIIMLAVLCHDLGKSRCTDSMGRSPGHENIGVGIAKKFLKRFTWDNFLIRAVIKLVKYHRMPLTLVEQKSTIKAYKRLALKLSPEVNFLDLYFVAWADIRGRNSKTQLPLDEGFNNNDEILNVFMEKVNEAGVKESPEEPVLRGRDIIDVIKPGPEMGKILREAYEIQIEQDIKDKEALKKLVLK